MEVQRIAPLLEPTSLTKVRRTTSTYSFIHNGWKINITLPLLVIEAPRDINKWTIPKRHFIHSLARSGPGGACITLLGLVIYCYGTMCIEGSQIEGASKAKIGVPIRRWLVTGASGVGLTQQSWIPPFWEEWHTPVCPLELGMAAPPCVARLAARWSCCFSDQATQDRDLAGILAVVIHRNRWKDIIISLPLSLSTELGEASSNFPN